MFKKALALASLATCLAIPTIASGALGTAVTVTTTVDSIVEWDSATQSITIPNITAPNSSQSSSTTMALYSNDINGLTIAATGTVNGGILTAGAGGTLDTLTTTYTLNGNGLLLADRDGGVYLSTAAFFAKTYSVPYVNAQGTYQIIIGAKAASGARAPNADTYTCEVTLTVTAL